MHPTFVRQLDYASDAKFGNIQQVFMDFAVTQCFFTSMKISFAMSHSAKEWSSPQTALTYLNLADAIPHRSEGESVLIDYLPENTKRILDLGTGNGRLIRLIKVFMSVYPEKINRGHEDSESQVGALVEF